MRATAEILSRTLAEARRAWLSLTGIAAVILLGNWATAVGFRALKSLYAGAGLFDAGLRVSVMDFAALGIVPITAASLLAEARILGWEASSLKKLFACANQSVRTDLFYLVLNASNLHLLLGLAFSGGAGYWLQLRLQESCGWALMKEAPLAAQFVVQLFAGSLVFYAAHWLLHTRLLWEIHKVHHAAETMTMANNFRAHPVTHAVRGLLEAFAGAALGIHPAVILAYLAVTGVAVVWQHCDVDWRLPWLERFVFIGAAAHRIHHSRVERYYTTNLGIFVFWDWLFGTLASDPDPFALPIGVDDPAHNRSSAAQEMFSVEAVELRTLWRAALSVF